MYIVLPGDSPVLAAFFEFAHGLLAFPHSLSVARDFSGLVVSRDFLFGNTCAWWKSFGIKIADEQRSGHQQWLLLHTLSRSSNLSRRGMLLLILLGWGPCLSTAAPRFDSSAVLRDVLVPADAAALSVIYRLRASDPSFAYPLVFEVKGSSSHVDVESLNCTRFNSVCQANVVLKTRLEIGRIYDFTVEVSSQSNQTATMDCSFVATNATTPVHRIFPGAPSLLRVSEGARRNTELGALLARGNPLLPRAVFLELWGAPEFGLRQKLVSETDAEATVLLLSSLDYEKKNVHHLTILANDPWTDMATDTRNIAGWPLVVVVIDEQDTPPVFSIAPPTTALGVSLRPGDVVLKVHAEDGDRGNPRVIKYALVPGGDPSDHYFDIDEDSGELRLAVPLSDIHTTSRSGQPILVHVVAEEVRSRSDEAPAQSTTVQLALIPPGASGRSPTFGAIDYHALLDENAPTGTSLEIAQAEVNSQPGELVLLELDNNNGTFDISPKTVTDGHSKFQITVHDPSLLDYEARQSVDCYIVARELGAGNHSARAKLTVLLNNLNDNPPKFTQEEYRASVQEHAPMGTNIMVVEAVDGDKDPKSKVRYTKLLGPGSQFFQLDPDTGLISVADSEGLDAETGPVITFQVEARDADGTGMSTTTRATITLLDINDNAPQFDKKVYEFILNEDKNGFTNAAAIRATDRDVSPPNNEIHYEIIDMPSYLHLDERTGELSVRKPWPSGEVTVLRGRAWDGGVPRLSSECEIRIYPSEGQARRMVFIVPGKNPDRAEVAKTLGTLTGGRVAIDRIRTYTGDEPGAMYVSTYADDGERSVVEATVTFYRDSIIDLNEINKIINNKQAEETSGANKKMQENNVKEIIRIREGHGGSLLWLLIFFFILLIIALLLLICCCLCRECPLYNYATIFQKSKDTPVVEKIHILGSGQGRESKSVQVAEWFGRKEAWTPDNVDAESIRRYEIDRGSERGGAKPTLIRQSNVQQEPPRDQFYFREGNTDILRLITRGGEAQKLNEQPYMASDSGKDILMKRFMDQQQTEVTRPRVSMPNSVSRLQAEQELLENSLRQQNALLRQILLERERDLRLETQSLPAGTQTDQDAGTQTEPIYLRPPARKVRSDNDQSDLTEAEDEIAAIKARTRRRQGKKTRLKRAIRTPIQEEAETETIEKAEMRTEASGSRKRGASSETKSTRSRSSKSNGLRREVLEEISASLEQSDSEGAEGYRKREAFSDDSLEATPRSERTSTDSARHKYHSESDLRMVASVRNQALLKKKRREFVSKSQVDLTKSKSDRKPRNTTAKHQGSRYMDWYKKKPPAKGETPAAKGSAKRRASASHKGVAMHVRDSAGSKEVGAVESSVGPDHPLLQHSEHRFEVRYPRKPEEDVDSGIVLTKPPIAQKKSVFTIAYDGMHTKQLRTDSVNSP